MKNDKTNTNYSEIFDAYLKVKIQEHFKKIIELYIET